MNVLRDLSVILLAAEALLFALIPLAFVAGLVYGAWWLSRHRNLPTWLRDTRRYVMLGASYVDTAMDALAKPVVAAHSAFARLEGWLGALQERRH